MLMMEVEISTWVDQVTDYMKRGLVQKKEKLSFVRSRIHLARSDRFAIDTPLRELVLDETIYEKKVNEY